MFIFYNIYLLLTTVDLDELQVSVFTLDEYGKFQNTSGPFGVYEADVNEDITNLFSYLEIEPGILVIHLFYNNLTFATDLNSTLSNITLSSPWLIYVSILTFLIILF